MCTLFWIFWNFNTQFLNALNSYSQQSNSLSGTFFSINSTVKTNPRPPTNSYINDNDKLNVTTFQIGLMM